MGRTERARDVTRVMEDADDQDWRPIGAIIDAMRFVCDAAQLGAKVILRATNHWSVADPMQCRAQSLDIVDRGSRPEDRPAIVSNVSNVVVRCERQLWLSHADRGLRR